MDPKRPPASKVVHVRGLAPKTSENDIKNLVQKYGNVSYVLMLPQNNQALIEFENIEGARNLVITTGPPSKPLYLHGMPCYFNFSTSQYIQRTKKETKLVNPNILLFTIINAKYPITIDTIRKICEPYGKILKIVIFHKLELHALVQLADEATAFHVKNNLEGCDIYADCCTIKIEFARTDDLNVSKNDSMTWALDKESQQNVTNITPNASLIDNGIYGGITPISTPSSNPYEIRYTPDAGNGIRKTHVLEHMYESPIDQLRSPNKEYDYLKMTKKPSEIDESRIIAHPYYSIYYDRYLASTGSVTSARAAAKAAALAAITLEKPTHMDPGPALEKMELDQAYFQPNPLQAHLPNNGYEPHQPIISNSYNTSHPILVEPRNPLVIRVTNVSSPGFNRTGGGMKPNTSFAEYGNQLDSKPKSVFDRLGSNNSHHLINRSYDHHLPISIPNANLGNQLIHNQLLNNRLPPPMPRGAMNNINLSNFNNDMRARAAGNRFGIRLRAGPPPPLLLNVIRNAIFNQRRPSPRSSHFNNKPPPLMSINPLHAHVNAHGDFEAANQNGESVANVFVLFGIEPSQFNCRAIFNLFSAFGVVLKVKFLRNHPDRAVIEMRDSTTVSRMLNQNVLNRHMPPLCFDTTTPAHDKDQKLKTFFLKIGPAKKPFDSPDPVIVASSYKASLDIRAKLEIKDENSLLDGTPICVEDFSVLDIRRIPKQLAEFVHQQTPPTILPSSSILLSSSSSSSHQKYCMGVSDSFPTGKLLICNLPQGIGIENVLELFGDIPKVSTENVVNSVINAKPSKILLTDGDQFFEHVKDGVSETEPILWDQTKTALKNISESYNVMALQDEKILKSACQTALAEFDSISDAVKAICLTNFTLLPAPKDIGDFTNGEGEEEAKTTYFLVKMFFWSDQLKLGTDSNFNSPRGIKRKF